MKQIFSLLHGSSLNPLCSTIYRTKVFNFEEVEFITFFMDYAFDVKSKNSLALKAFLCFFLISSPPPSVYPRNSTETTMICSIRLCILRPRSSQVDSGWE